MADEDQLLEREALLEEIVDVVCPLLLAPGTRNHHDVQLLASQSQPVDQRKGGRHSYHLAKGVVDEGDELIKEEIPVFGLAVCPFYPSLYPLQLLDGPVMIAPSALGLLECPVRVPARDPSLQCAARGAVGIGDGEISHRLLGGEPQTLHKVHSKLPNHQRDRLAPDSRGSRAEKNHEQKQSSACRGSMPQHGER